ncbi:MAG: hypothetical protein LBE12_14690 [Planctomycetaceae bacterium]|nr:hypothetical protein [Planctomycetaceae bacterium]
MPQAELLPFGSNPLATLSTFHSPLSTINYYFALDCCGEFFYSLRKRVLF